MSGRAQLLSILLCLGPLPGQETRPAAPARPKAEETAARFLAAFRAKDSEAMAALAAALEPDPFLVADALLGRALAEPGDFLPAARAYAAFFRGGKAASRLPEAVAGWEGWGEEQKRRESRLRELLADIKAKSGPGKHKQILDLLDRMGEAVQESPASVARVQLRHEWMEAFYFLGRLAEAEKACQELYRDARELGWLAKQATARSFGGNIASRLGEPARARTLWEEEVGLRELLGNPAGLANALWNLGHLHLVALHEYEQAVPLLRRSIEQVLQHGDRKSAAPKIGFLGDALAKSGRLEEAIEAYGRAREGLMAAGDRVMAAFYLGSIGAAQEKLGRIAAARASHEKALEEARALRHPGLHGHVLRGLGEFFLRTGRPELALEHYTDQRELTRAAGDRSGEASALGNMGLAHQYAGRFGQAIDLLERALELARAAKDGASIAAQSERLGMVYAALNLPGRALPLLETALRIEESIGDPASILTTIGNLGIVQKKLQDYEAASVSFRRALALAEKVHDPGAFAASLLNLGNVLAWLGRSEEALERLRRAVELSEALGWRRTAAAASSNLGNLLIEKGLLEEAGARLEKALALQDSLAEERSEAIVLGHLARLRSLQGKHGEAMALARNSLVLHLRGSQGLGEPEALGLRPEVVAPVRIGLDAAFHLLCAREGEKKDLPSQAFWFLEAGRPLLMAQALQAGRSSSLVPEELLAPAASAREEAVRRQRELAGLLSAGNGTAGEIERARRELDSAYQRLEDAVARIHRRSWRAGELFAPRPAPLAVVQASLPPDAALLCYQQMEQGRFLAFVVRADTADLFAVEGGAGLAGLIERYRRVLSMPDSDEEELATVLHDLLIAPLEGALEGKKRLLVSPCSILAFLPFEALRQRTASGGKRLLERWDVSYVPSGTAYAALKGEARAAGRGLLALGDPVYPGEQKPNGSRIFREAELRGLGSLDRIPGTGEEVASIATLFGQEPITLLLREEATRARLLEALERQGRLSALHLACHGHVDTVHPMLTGLVLGGGDVLSLADLQGLRLDADLVVLSACETARGKLVEGEGVLGLVRGFLVAGASRVVVSNWKVADRTTQSLMVDFYRGMRERGLAPGQALQEAKRARLRAGSRHAHPFHWAGFVLWGRED